MPNLDRADDFHEKKYPFLVSWAVGLQLAAPDHQHAIRAAVYMALLAFQKQVMDCPMDHRADRRTHSHIEMRGGI